MIIDQIIISKLINLDLEMYVGKRELSEIKQETIKEWVIISERISVEVKLGQRFDCPEDIYQVAKRVEGNHDSIRRLRMNVMQDLSKTRSGVGFNLLTVTFDGIYIGEPEDIYNSRMGTGVRTLYPVQRFGEKIADIYFKIPGLKESGLED